MWYFRGYSLDDMLGVYGMIDKLEKILVDRGGVEVTPYSMYEDIFRLGDGYIQCSGKDKETSNHKANPIVYYKNDNSEKGHYRILFDDTFKETLEEALEADFCIINGITYFGRKNLSAHANKMYAMIIDLDGVGERQLVNFLDGALSDYPYWHIPNYIVLSGHGIHIYYLFEEPIPLFPNMKIQVKELKYATIKKIWNEYTSTIDKIQFQGINQGFRPPGAKTKIKGYRSKVYKLNTHPCNLETLGGYVDIEFRVDEEKLFKESKLTLEQARVKYPLWYEKRIVNKEKSVNKWDIASKVHGNNPYALYDWWMKKLRTGASYHHRYFCVMAAVIYAVKVGVPFEKVKEDCYNLIPFMNTLTNEEKFKAADVKSALELYDERYCTFPISDIIKITDINIEKNKRNGQKQADHLEEARAIRDIRQKRQGKKWTDGNGRKSKGDIVKAWQREHPGGKVTECARELNISRPTVYKYWNDKGVE